MQTILDSITMACKDGKKDAVYSLQIELVAGGCLVHFQNGRAGGTLKHGTKTAAGPVSEAEARRIFESVVKEKLRASPPYKQVDGQGQTFTAVAAEVAERATGLLPQLLNEIDGEDAQAIEEKLTDDSFCAEHKHDGERRMVRSAGDGSVPIGSNRKGQQVPLPGEIAEAVAGVCCTLDGEIIGSQFYAFDLLELNGTDLRGERHELRKAKLHNLASKLGRSIQVVATAYTTEEKRALLELSRLMGQEGVVFKDIGAPYVEGRPNSGGPQLKLKHWKEATVIVMGANVGKRSVRVGVIDDRHGGCEVVEVGSVTVPPSEPMPAAEALLDVRYLYAFDNGGSLFQPVFRRLRGDLDRSAASIRALKYKADHADVPVTEQQHAKMAA